MKKKGIIAIALVICLTLACGGAVTYTYSANKYSKSYSETKTLAGINFVVVGNQQVAVTTIVNTTSSTYCLESAIKEVNLATLAVTDYSGKNGVATLGTAMSCNIERDWDNSNLSYQHIGYRWAVPDMSQTNSSNLIDKVTYTITQSAE